MLRTYRACFNMLDIFQACSACIPIASATCLLPFRYLPLSSLVGGLLCAVLPLVACHSLFFVRPIPTRRLAVVPFSHRYHD
ncbi:hypothetical protein HOY80DRAFT_941387, partial [Tuber brumale]